MYIIEVIYFLEDTMHFGYICHPQVSIDNKNISEQLWLVHDTLYYIMASIPAIFDFLRIPSDSGIFPYKTSTYIMLLTIKIEYNAGPLDDYIN